MKYSVVHTGSKNKVWRPALESRFEVPPRDVPYFLDVKRRDDSNTITVNLGFTGGTEHREWKVIPDIAMCYGTKSGRVYYVELKLHGTNQMPSWRDMKTFEKGIALNKHGRFSRNILHCLMLVEAAAEDSMRMSYHGDKRV